MHGCQRLCLTELYIVFPKRSRISDKDCFCHLLCAQVVIRPLKINKVHLLRFTSHSSSGLHLRASVCIFVCLYASACVRLHTRTIGFRAPGCALISTVCSSVLCSFVVVFEVMKKRNVYEHHMCLYTTLSMDTGKLRGTTSWSKK